MAKRSKKQKTVVYKGYACKLVDKWVAPEEGGAPILTMPNVPHPLHGCLRGDAEALTINGWKRIDSVTVEDTVATWDKETERIIWDHPYETVKKYYKQMVRIEYEKYRTFGMLISPDHRLPIRKQTDGRKQINGVREFVGREWALADTTAAKINLNAFQHFITAARNGTDYSSELTNMERVYISIQADGSLRHEKNGEYTYRMSLKKNRKKARFANLCWNSGVKFHEHNHGEESYATQNGYQRFDVIVDKECKNFWNCFNIKDFGQVKAQQFIDEISLWDGSCAETCGILNRRYVTTSLDNAKFAQAVAVIAGVTSSFQIRKPDVSKNKSECYIIDFLDRDYRATQSCVKTVEDYDDYAYCINVPTSYFVVRDADSQSVMITGNCAPRTILGTTTWNHMRNRCYYEANYTCEICGEKVATEYYENGAVRHQYHNDGTLPKRALHGHELYSIDYNSGTMKFERVVATCEMDHIRFIHSGRMLTMYKKGDPLMPAEKVLEGLEHGFKQIYEWNKAHYGEEDLRVYYAIIDYTVADGIGDKVKELIKKYKIKFYMPDGELYPKGEPIWQGWKLIIGGKEYPSPYKSRKEWEEAMERNNKEQLEKRTTWVARTKKFDSIDSVDISEEDMKKINDAELPEGF